LPFSPSLDLRVLLFNFGLAVMVSVIFSLAPAIQFWRPDLMSTLKQQVVTAGSPLRFRRLSVAVQIGLSLLLLVGAGLFVRTLRNLQSADIGFSYLAGSTRDRQRAIEEFSSGNVPVFLISLKAGGFGLNLTQADYCFVLDPWWNPAAEAQAVDRAHRIGQTRPVMVYRLVAKDTIEEKVMALKARKEQLFGSIMSDDLLGETSLTADEIRELLTG